MFKKESFASDGVRRAFWAGLIYRTANRVFNDIYEFVLLRDGRMVFVCGRLFFRLTTTND